MFTSKNTFLTPPSGGYTINRSVRTRSSASGYFNRTFASSGNRLKWTWSAWLKRGVLSTSQPILACPISSGVSEEVIYLFSNDQLALNDGTVGALAQTTAVFRDPSAWYHIMFVYDSAQGTAANRGIFYVNGVQQTNSVNSISLSRSSYINSASVHAINSLASIAGYYVDGYTAEVNFVDGQALTPSSFGATDAITGVWNPIKYTGSYGTNGYYLNFSDNSAATATTLGKDSSGNGNNWTPNNISVTTGATYDSMVDSPTVGPTSSNYCTINPLSKLNWLSQGGVTTPSAGNLTFSYDGQGSMMDCTMAVRTGKWYWEVTQASYTMNGIRATRAIPTGSLTYYYYQNNGGVYYTAYNSASPTALTTLSTSAAGDIIGIALDLVNNTIAWYKNGTLIYTATSIVADEYTPCVGGAATGNSAYINFGQRPFTYTPPSGFLSLNTQNLATPTIANGATSMGITLYTGTNANQSLTNTTNGTSFKPDFVWIKCRNSAAFSHRLFNSSHYTNVDLQTNTSNGNTSEANSLTAFNSNGFSVGVDTAGGGVNSNGYTYVAWQWKALNAGFTTNFDGTISGNVNTNPTTGLSFTVYTGTGTNATVGHGLGVAPSMIIVKQTSGAGQDWQVYHASYGQNYSAQLNQDYPIGNYTNYWYNGVTSTVFGINGSYPGVNANGANYIAYCFAQISGYSSFGTYVGNGSADGPFIQCGFRPRWILIKGASFTSNWFIQDSARNGYNVNNGVSLRPNLASAEDAVTTYNLDILSNGFKLRSGAGDSNTSGATFIYAAFAENPFKYSRAR